MALILRNRKRKSSQISAVDDDIDTGPVLKIRPFSPLTTRPLNPSRIRPIGQLQGIANQLPNSDKFANITRPLIAANITTLTRKNKLNMGSHSKPRDKVDQVSKIIIKL